MVKLSLVARSALARARIFTLLAFPRALALAGDPRSERIEGEP
jgi:hypothetical protein